MILKKYWYVPLIPFVLLVLYFVVCPIEVQETLTENDPVLIIDAGHGGADGGAVAEDGTQEADINLDIALRAELIAELCGVATKMTRDSVDIDYPDDADTLSKMKVADQHTRVDTINGVAGGVLLSIHQNFYPAHTPFGPQVFYGKSEAGEAFAVCVQNNLTALLSPDNRRLAAPISEDIFLMKKASCPAVLVECGFLSNPTECSKLESEDYRMQLSLVLIGSYLQYIRGYTI